MITAVVGFAGVSVTAKPKKSPPFAAVAIAVDTPDTASFAASALTTRIVAAIVTEPGVTARDMSPGLTDSPAAEARFALKLSLALVSKSLIETARLATTLT